MSAQPYPNLSTLPAPQRRVRLNPAAVASALILLAVIPLTYALGSQGVRRASGSIASCTAEAKRAASALATASDPGTSAAIRRERERVYHACIDKAALSALPPPLY